MIPFVSVKDSTIVAPVASFPVRSYAIAVASHKMSVHSVLVAIFSILKQAVVKIVLISAWLVPISALIVHNANWAHF